MVDQAFAIAIPVLDIETDVAAAERQGEIGLNRPLAGDEISESVSLCRTESASA
ncbi:hypothetical protein EDC39_11490 [Geothermobacter ehrlichii]|uniref:Uncharacterized protein n=1 Tax=Geothermobacter ehrlichii TaxID=213224 RepID=A0A5D3WHC1_9BACT|nr:hypothetical protein [Geothermobacter ehrlichii]TYO96383.1 hypothetical protein EDC39_11490 [Geothermobacter ehrlichii]